MACALAQPPNALSTVTSAMAGTTISGSFTGIVDIVAAGRAARQVRKPDAHGGIRSRVFNNGDVVCHGEPQSNALSEPSRPLDNTDLNHYWRKRMTKVYIERALRDAAGFDPMTGRLSAQLATR